jgi:hypothetical protein
MNILKAMWAGLDRAEFSLVGAGASADPMIWFARQQIRSERFEIGSSADLA